MDTKISKITTRYANSSLEVAFFMALLTIDRIRKHLGITVGEIVVEFMSTAFLLKPDLKELAKRRGRERAKGTVTFNVGAGTWDQHGRPENASLCSLCSLDLVRGEYDFLSHRPWLRQIYNTIRRNDIDGQRVSKNPQNIRELMVGLSAAYPNDHHKVLDVLTLAFVGVFARAKAGISEKRVFDIKEILIGVAEAEPARLAEFNKQVQVAQLCSRRAWNEAKQAVTKAKRRGKTWEVDHPHLTKLLGRKIQVIEIHTNSPKAGQAARRAGYDLVVVYRPNRHCQIFSSTMECKEVVGKYKFDLGVVARHLRILEAKMSGKNLPSKKGQDWESSGFVYYQDGTACPLYLAEFRSSLFFGSLSSPDVPASKIRHDKLTGSVVHHLRKCVLLHQVNGDWTHLETVAVA